MKQAKRAVAGRVIPGLMALWLIFMGVFSWYQVKSTRDKLLMETDAVMKIQVSYLTDCYMQHYGQESEGMLFSVEGKDEIRAWMAHYMSGLRSAGIEAVVYDEKGEKLAGAENELLVSYTVPPASDTHRRYGEIHYGVLELEEVFSQEDASRIVEYLAYWDVDGFSEENGLIHYDISVGRFMTDGYRVVPLDLAVYEVRNRGTEGYVPPSFDENGVYENNSDCLVVWEYHCDTMPEIAEGWYLLVDQVGTVYPNSAYGNDHTTQEQKERMQDEFLLKRIRHSGVEMDEWELWHNTNTFLGVDGFLQTEFIGVWSASALANTLDGPGYSPRIYATGTVYPLKESMPLIGMVGAFSFALIMVMGIILIWQMGKVLAREKQLEQRRRSLTNAIAHDLKTPMAAVLGYAENLMEQTNPEKQEHYLSALQTQTLRMNGILGKMLELSGTENGEASLTLGEFSLREAAEEAAGNVLLEEQPEIIGDTVLMADRSLILRVLENYLSNALRYKLPGTAIQIEISDDRCAVYNHGKTIPEEALEKIWEPCYQVESQRNPGCSGLGLTICREILMLHNFSYGAENRAEGVAVWFRWKK